VLAVRRCSELAANGKPCRAKPQRDSLFCFWHDPGNEEEVAEARRLGGLRRRREKTVSGAYDFTGLGSVEEIRRLLDIAAVDTLGLENGIARSRVLVQVALAAAKLLETGELEARVELLEAAVGAKRPDPIDGGGSGLYDVA
jgi:hypothetical protein